MVKEIDNIMKDFYKKAKPATNFNQITEKIIEEERNKLIDSERLKQNEVYNLLANQIVGSEIYLY